MIDVEGIIVSSSPYKESSKLIRMITKDNGIISLIAKGSRTMKSDLRVVTDKITYAKYTILYKEKGLSILISGDIINPLKVIKKDLIKISYVTFLLDLTEQVMKQNSDENIFKLLTDSILKIEENYDPLIITNILEFKLLEYLGVMPVIDRCSVCGSTTSIATLSSYRGGYVCNKCLTNELIVSEKTIKLIRMFYYLDISKISKLDISKKVMTEINNFLSEYYDSYTGLYLKSKDFLKSISNLM